MGGPKRTNDYPKFSYILERVDRFKCSLGSGWKILKRGASHAKLKKKFQNKVY